MQAKLFDLSYPNWTLNVIGAGRTLGNWRGEINHRRQNAAVPIWFSCSDKQGIGRAVNYGVAKAQGNCDCCLGVRHRSADMRNGMVRGKVHSGESDSERACRRAGVNGHLMAHVGRSICVA